METKKVCEITVSGGNKRVPLPQLCINIMGVCLGILGRDDREFLGLAHATLRGFTESQSAEGRKFEIKTLVRILFAIGTKPEQFTGFGMTSNLANTLQTKMDAIIHQYEIEGYEPDSDFVTQTFGNKKSKEWIDIFDKAKSLIPDASEDVDDLLHAKVVSSPVKHVILDMISEGKIVAGLPFSIADVRNQIRDRKGMPVELLETELALQCLVEKQVMDRRNSTYRLNSIDENAWEELTEFRKAIECTNIGRLVRDANRCDQTIREARAWLLEMEEAVRSNNVSGFFSADVRFHMQLASQSDFAHRALGGLVTFIRLAAPRLASTDSMKRLLEDHQRVYDCISKAANHNLARRSDVEEEARQLMGQHLENSCILFRQAVASS